jgi:hypothetical protein
MRSCYLAGVRWADRYTWIRIAIGCAVLIVVGCAAGVYMCRCPGNAASTVKTTEISTELLKAHVQELAGQIGERNIFLDGTLDRAAGYIERVWKEQGYDVVRHSYRVENVDSANLEVTRRGTGRPAEIILVGAHYDSVIGSPGANDNATGVAALLEISRHFLTLETKRSVRFVAFVNEEPPLFETPQMGSRVYAKMARQRGDDIRAMISLETIGYYSDAPGSQHYPPLFNFFYPDRGNFIAFVSNFRSRGLLHRAVAAFRAHSDFPVECVATFEAIPGVNWSDHASFWREGYRAIMVTDTAPYRYPHYHSETDTPDRVNYPALTRVAEGLAAVTAALAAD